MNINVKKFKDVLKKATLNYQIETVQLNYDKAEDKIWSRMMSGSFDAATIIKVDNDVFEDVNEDLSLHFASLKTELKPYLDLFGEEPVSLKITDTCLVLNKQVKLHFDDPSIIDTTNGQKLEAIEDFFVDFTLDEDFKDKFENVKKIGSRFGRIYLNVKNKFLYIETTDKNNAYSNSVKYSLCDVEYDDLTLCFDYQFFVNLMNVIMDRYTDFTMKLCYMKDKNAGVLKMISGDEKYYLISKME